MSALPIIITTAGLTALVNAQNTGASNVVIASLGVSPTQIAASAATAAIPGEVKRIAGVAGQVVADDQIYISAADQTEDTYTVRTIGLYLNTGVLFGVYSQAAPLLEKAAPAMAVLEAAIKLSAPQANAITFEGGGWLNPQASETVQGVVKLAPLDEAVLGADHSKAVTPKGLKAVTTALVAAIQATFDQIAQTLAGKANTVHQHGAGDVTSGVFNEARIPSLPLARITGLIDALAGKAAAVHQHAAADVTSGVFDVARIPALAMEKITGLANALAGKASLNASVTFADVRVFDGAGGGVVYLGDLSHFLVYDGVKYILPNAPLVSAGGTVWTSATFNPASKANVASPGFTGTGYFGTDKRGQIWLVGGDDRAGLLEFRSNGVRLGYIGYGDGPDGNLYISGDNGRSWIFAQRPNFNGATPWDTANFNPADKANAIHSHDWSQVTGKDDVVLKSATNLGRTGAGLLVKLNTAQEYGDQPTGWSAILTPDSAWSPDGGYGYFMKTGRRDNDGGWGGIYVGRVTEANQPPNLHVGVAITRNHQPFWAKLWSDATLQAASPAEAAAGAATDRFITPAALSSFARNLGTSGYAVIPGTGLMIQWGVVTSNIAEGSTHAYLPVAFGGGCLVALATPRNPGSNVNSDYYMQVVGRYQDRIVFFANRANGSAGNLDGYEWIALGRVNGAPDPAYSSGGGGGGGGGGGYIDPQL
jgi:hypothetical protein